MNPTPLCVPVLDFSTFPNVPTRRTRPVPAAAPLGDFLRLADSFRLALELAEAAAEALSRGDLSEAARFRAVVQIRRAIATLRSEP